MTVGAPEERYLSLYLDEASKRLRSMEESVAVLTRGPNPPALDTLHRCAHSMKGMSAMMGFTVLASIARRIEETLGAVRLGGPAAPPYDVASLQRRVIVLRRGVTGVARRAALRPPGRDDLSRPLPAS